MYDIYTCTDTSSGNVQHVSKCTIESGSWLQKQLDFWTGLSWLLAFLPPFLSLDMDLQVKHVEFDTRPCAMISVWCGSLWQVSLADLTLNHGAWKSWKKHSLLLEVSFCQFGLSASDASVRFQSESSAKGLIEKHYLQARSCLKKHVLPFQHVSSHI